MAHWYDDKAALRAAIARAVEGYKGQVAARWHVIPIGFKKYTADLDDLIAAASSPSHATFALRVGDCGGLPGPDDATIRARILRLRAVSAEDADYISFMTSFTHIAFGIEDASGTTFRFDMLLNEGDGDANTGFFAVVWHGETEVAHCTQGGDMVTAISWIDDATLAQYVPHAAAGFLPPTHDKNLERHEVGGGLKELHHEYFESSWGYSGIYCAHADGPNQLELLLAVVAKLSEHRNAVFFPQVVPAALLQDAKVDYLKDILQRTAATESIWHVTGDFLEHAVYRDESRTFREEDQWDD
ncbi:Aste57867_16412 [Aphanomyces stellatus]|uniref:Aste57867_16412 protein n=1 Tax=Aphanomyces stellatus TaxID=120398 RepID=A0A485L5L3_9STRA|nr:hypothetical protein As57867_016355 [Aphanomyces stellatus]VFT93187.1 Aste57867_16412 [Aphanomyces stellatus]